MKNRLKNKKAVSVVLSYVVLIIIVLTLAGITYGWLKFRIPKDTPECDENIALIIKDVNAVGGKVTITFQNKGFFTVNGILLRYSNESGAPPTHSFKTTEGEASYFNITLSPGDETTIGAFEYSGTLEKIELIPFIYDDETNEPILCENAKISETI